MGGCRCSFRQCHVTTSKYRRMHFFRFPLKEPERAKKWMIYAQMEEMMQYTETRRKNTVICARHFREEYFMNYKMEKLTPNALPTLIRLSENQALDFELDIENGVLVTLEKSKLKHLLPPDDFESPLHLENDRILMNMLNEIKYQPKAPISVEEEIEYTVTDDENEQFIMEKSAKYPSNTVEILETIQFSAPSKRTRNCSIDEMEVNTVDNISVKKFKILNSEHCSIVNEKKDETTVVLTSRPDRNDTNHVIISDNIEFVDSHNVQKQNADAFTVSNEGNEDLEFFEMHKDDNESLNGSATLGSDSTIFQLKTDTESFTESIKQQLLAAQNEISNLKNQNEEIEHLQLKIFLLENENSQLKETCKDTNELRKKLLQLGMKSNQIENILKENKALKEEIAKYREKYKKPHEEDDNIPLLKAKLRSKVQETEELKKIVEGFKNTRSNAYHDNMANEDKLKEEISCLQKQKEIKEKELLFAKSKLLKIETDFNAMKNEKNSLQQKYSDLEQKYLKLQALQIQEGNVSTSFDNSTVNTNKTAAPISTATLTKAQLFNGIKRYVSSAMVSLLRMEMFGSSEREWKTDERLVAVDIFRLGETVYKYFTDEWRFRLPALRDVRGWLIQSEQMYDEDDP